MWNLSFVIWIIHTHGLNFPQFLYIYYSILCFTHYKFYTNISHEHICSRKCANSTCTCLTVSKWQRRARHLPKATVWVSRRVRIFIAAWDYRTCHTRTSNLSVLLPHYKKHSCNSCNVISVHTVKTHNHFASYVSQVHCV